MRDLVKKSGDKKLLAILDIIEKHLALEFEKPAISAIPATASDQLVIAAVRHDQNGYAFVYDPDSEYTHPDVIFHELMHISQHIEGWPIMKPGPGGCGLWNLYGEKVMWDTFYALTNLFTHSDIYLREKQCGYSSSQEKLWNDTINDSTLVNIPIMWDSDWDTMLKTYKNMAAIPLRVLFVIPAMLSPASRENHKLLRESLKKHLPPLAYQQVETIYRVFAKPRRPFPQSIPDALAKLENKLRLPPNLLELHYLSNTNPAFYTQMLKSVS